MAARIIVVDRMIPSMALKRRAIVMMINMVLVPCDMIIHLKSQKFPCISSNHRKNNWHNDVKVMYSLFRFQFFSCIFRSGDSIKLEEIVNKSESN